MLKRKGLWSQEWYPERLDQCRERNPAVLPGQRYFSDCQKMHYLQANRILYERQCGLYLKKKKVRKVSIFKEQEKEKAD